MPGFKAGMLLPGQAKPGFNACVFATAQEADDAANELMSRWFVPIGHVVEEVETEPNYVFKDGKPQSIA